uniref:Clathrin interactor EPSIN 1-like isoform X3 n=1 Tax=Rhizophora mucronata TaxID=61149 RepID=A0A2P2L1N5_RHIMU
MTNFYLLRPPNWYCWLPRFEKKSSPVVCDCDDVNPDLPRPDPVPIALPI